MEYSTRMSELEHVPIWMYKISHAQAIIGTITPCDTHVAKMYHLDPPMGQCTKNHLLYASQTVLNNLA